MNTDLTHMFDTSPLTLSPFEAEREGAPIRASKWRTTTGWIEQEATEAAEQVFTFFRSS